MQPNSDGWNEYKRLIEQCAKNQILSQQDWYYIMNNMLTYAKVLCCTLDTFLQIVSGKSELQATFKHFSFPFAVIDEGHQSQIDLRLVAAASLSVNSLLLLVDEDQTIDYARPCDKVVQQAERLSGEYWPWQRSLGRNSLQVWSCLATETFMLNTCWRFGRDGVNFLLKVFPPYIVKDNEDPRLLSPKQADYFQQELDRVPDSRVRLVHYKRTPVLASRVRGSVLRKELGAPPPRRQGVQYDATLAIGSCPLIFFHLFHEGAVFLKCLAKQSSEMEQTHETACATYRRHASNSHAFLSQSCCDCFQKLCICPISEPGYPGCV